MRVKPTRPQCLELNLTAYYRAEPLRDFDEICEILRSGIDGRTLIALCPRSDQITFSSRSEPALARRVARIITRHRYAISDGQAGLWELLRLLGALSAAEWRLRFPGQRVA